MKKKTAWLFVFQKYENFEAFSNEHNPFISEGCMSFTHLEKDYLFIANVVVNMLTLKISPKFLTKSKKMNWSHFS